MKRWSKLKRDLENLMAPKLEFRIYANAYKIGDTVPLPRFWITVGGKIIWDWPRDFMDQQGWYFYDSAKKISQLLRDYINTPDSDLITKPFEDPFKLIPVLRVCDKRIGKRRLEKLFEDPENFEVAFIITNRLSLRNDEIRFEMSNLLPCRTGLKYTVWYSAHIPGQKPKIKVDLPDGKSVYIQIEDHEVEGHIDDISSNELQKIFDWIDLNKEALLKYWNEAPAGIIDTEAMNKLLKPIKNHCNNNC